ncbi:unnamed protein product [Phytophthora lilii]|uniref:Unnamed protein product n=1 Tax=Phytophthora lilii TaxID=2077276 RepID=A0A9W6TAE9_9STRA|nr:unnamed protein product [Phytophthora lilii]
MGYQYEIHGIAGDDNVWANLLSRWGLSFRTVCAIRQVPLPLSPQLEDNFVWPTMKTIFEVQNDATPPKDIKRSTKDLLLRDERGLNKSEVCVDQHGKDVDFFVRRCLHCASTLGGPPQPRPLGEAMHAEKPNKLIHWDFFFMGKSDTDQECVLVIKDDASKFVWLIRSKTADADTTFSALLDWFASFGVCRSWVSDQGTHFKNAVIEGMQHALGAHHHFTTARCRWANGTVEVVMRETLRCCSALLSEWRLRPREWSRVIKIVQLVLNNTPSPSLGGVASVTAMTGLSAMGPSDHIAIPGPVELATLAEI